MEIKTALREIGLTESEAKVYVALLKNGPSSKAGIVKNSKTSSSKIYEVLERLSSKGLVSKIIKDGKQYFNSCPISRIKDLLENKKKEVERQENLVDEISKKIFSITKKEARIEIFFGWRGMETVYSLILGKIKKGQEIMIIGAGKGIDPDKMKEFFIKQGNLAFEMGLKIKVIFNEDARDYVREIEKESKIKYNKKFLLTNTPLEISVSENFSVIGIMKDEPIVILIEDGDSADSFRKYFKEMWKIAR